MDIYKNPITAIEKWVSEQEQTWFKKSGEKILEVKRKLSEEEIDEIYKYFLADNELVEEDDVEISDDDTKLTTQASDPANTTPPTIIQQLQLISLSDIHGVNAIIDGQSIDFHPNLTVIFGYNATGKSGYVRILKKASNSRTVEDIWDNIYKSKEKNRCSAKFKLIQDIEEIELEWDGETNLYPLNLIEVFDNKCVKVSLTEKLDFGFKPYGFELFSFLSSAIIAMKDRLTSQVEAEDQPKEFTYFSEHTAVAALISSLGHNTEIEAI